MEVYLKKEKKMEVSIIKEGRKKTEIYIKKMEVYINKKRWMKDKRWIKDGNRLYLQPENTRKADIS